LQWSEDVKSVKQPDGSWWVEDIPDCEPCGPYQNKEQAEEVRRGLERTFKHRDDRSFFTTDK
jgi:hypothetical protein